MPQTAGMSVQQVLQKAYAMPFSSPSYPPLPVEILEREQLAITYRTDPEKLRLLLPEPLEMDDDPLVSLTFLWMIIPGLGKYLEVAQSLSARYQGTRVLFRPTMYADNVPAIIWGRETIGLPKRFGQPTLETKNNILEGTLGVDGSLIAKATIQFRFEKLDLAKAAEAQQIPGTVLKIVPHVDGSHRILELVQFSYSEIKMKGAWSGPASLELHPHATAPLADLPVREIISASHSEYDCLLPKGVVIHDYLAK